MSSALTDPGCLILMVDESANMGSHLGKSDKSKADSVTTAINAFLHQLRDGPEFEVALLGYSTDAADQPRVGARWSGPLAGREFVPVSEFRAQPTAIETRVRRVPAPGGFGLPTEEQVQFPVWYRPQLGKGAPQTAAFQFCRDLLQLWGDERGVGTAPPILVHFTVGASTDGAPRPTIYKLRELTGPGAKTILIHVHLSSSPGVPPILYPSSRAHLPLGLVRDLYETASPLPDDIMQSLRAQKTGVNPGARGLVFHAQMLELLETLRVVREHVSAWPSFAPGSAILAPHEKGGAMGAGERGMERPPMNTETLHDFRVPDAPDVLLTDSPIPSSMTEESIPAPMPAPLPAESSANLSMGLDFPLPALGVETPPFYGNSETLEHCHLPNIGNAEGSPLAQALVVLVVERCANNANDPKNSCARLNKMLNELLADLGQRHLPIDVAVLTYGAADSTQSGVTTMFEGPNFGKSVIPADALPGGALRIEEVVEKIPDGTGGLIPVKRKYPIYFDLIPSAPATAVPAFEILEPLLTVWCSVHPSTVVAPMVLHATRGAMSVEEISAIQQTLGRVEDNTGPILLYHVVATETPARSVSYPARSDALENDSLRALWEVSSPLWGATTLAEEQAGLTARSRGFVVNGKFDLLVPGVCLALELPQ